MKNSYLYLLGKSWNAAEHRRKHFVLAYAMFFIANVIVVFEPMVLGVLLNTIQRGHPELLKVVALLLILYASLSFLFWIFHGNARVMERKTAFHVRRAYTEKMYRLIADLPLKWHRNHHTGETYDKTHKSANALWRFVDDGFSTIETSIKLISSLIAIVIFLPFYGSITMLIGSAICVIIFFFDRVLERQRKKINTNDHLVASSLFDYISNITTVITLRLEKLTKAELVQRMLKIRPQYYRNIYVNELKWFTVGMLVAGTLALLMFLYIFERISAGEVVLLGSVTALFQYIGRFSDAFFNIAWQYEELVWHATDVRSAEPIIQAHAELQQPEDFEPIKTDWSKICISGLWFAYEDDTRGVHHVDDVAITLKRGKRIALVGESGSGKSTLMHLLRGLQIADRVHIDIDGTRQPGLRVLSQTTTLIPQDPEIFENSLEYNITAGIEHSEEEVHEVCRVARFTPVLDRLENGLQTSIKEKGVNLSGGEKQRLALARGVFAARDSSIILLDEPTSSVDSKNEMEIFRNLSSHFTDRCIVASVHRLHMLTLFDEIYIMDQGRMVEHGTLDTLLAKNDGLLKKLWDKYVESETKEEE